MDYNYFSIYVIFQNAHNTSINLRFYKYFFKFVKLILKWINIGQIILLVAKQDVKKRMF